MAIFGSGSLSQRIRKVAPNQKRIPCNSNSSTCPSSKILLLIFLLVRLIGPQLIPWPQTQTTKVMCSSCARVPARGYSTQQRGNKMCTVITPSTSGWRKKHSNYAKLQRIFMANFTKEPSLRRVIIIIIICTRATPVVRII